MKRASSDRKRQRKRRRSGRIRDPETERLIHPDLKPAGSDLTPRHGTEYGYRDYGCHCQPCTEAVIGPRDGRIIVVGVLLLATGFGLLRARLLSRGCPCIPATIHGLPHGAAIIGFTLAMLSLLIGYLVCASGGRHQYRRCGTARQRRFGRVNSGGWGNGR